MITMSGLATQKEINVKKKNHKQIKESYTRIEYPKYRKYSLQIVESCWLH